MKQTKEELWAVASEYYKLKSEGKNPTPQYLDRNKIWTDYDADCPYFNDGDIWRLKPETIQHRGGKYPKPCTDVGELKDSLYVYTPGFETTDSGVFPVAHRVSILNWCVKVNAANSGLYYLNGEDAIDRAKVIYEID